MSAALPSDEVALDFQDSLQDLQNNNRYEISNLTIIAKENTEHAQAISQVLEKHIRTVRLGKTSEPLSRCNALATLPTLQKLTSNLRLLQPGNSLHFMCLTRLLRTWVLHILCIWLAISFPPLWMRTLS